MTSLFDFANLTLLISSLVKTTICAVFIQRYRVGVREIFRSRWSKRLTMSTMVTRDQDGITLQNIRVLSSMVESLAYIDWTNERTNELYIDDIYLWICKLMKSSDERCYNKIFYQDTIGFTLPFCKAKVVVSIQPTMQ